MIGKCPHCEFIGELFMGGGGTHGWCADWEACDYRYAIRRRHELPLVSAWAWGSEDVRTMALPF